MTVTTTLLFRQRGLCQQCRSRSDVTLCIVCSGSTLFYTYPAMFRQISWFYNGLVKKNRASVVKSRIESSGIPGLFLKQLPVGLCLKRCEQFIESD